MMMTMIAAAVVVAGGLGVPKGIRVLHNSVVEVHPGVRAMMKMKKMMTIKAPQAVEDRPVMMMMMTIVVEAAVAVVVHHAKMMTKDVVGSAIHKVIPKHR